MKFPAKHTALVLALAGASLFFAAGCNRQSSAGVAATVNGKAIPLTDVDKYYKNSVPDNRQPPPSPEQAAIQRMTILRQLIDEEILQQRAEKLNLAATSEEVDAKLAEMKAPFTQEEFDARLKNNGLTVDDIRKQLRRSVTIDKLFNKEINTRINVTDSDIQKYYDANKASYNLVEPSYHLAQIVVTPVPPKEGMPPVPGKATNDAEAKKKIQMLHQRLESGDDFGALAMNYSERPDTAANGGDMGFVSDSQLKVDATVYNAVQKLKPGEFTDVLPLQDNDPQHRIIAYQIFRMIAKEPAGQRQLNDPRVQQDIRQRIRDARSQVLKTAYYEMLRDEAHVRNYMAEKIFKDGEQ